MINTQYDDKCPITCTDNDRVVEAEVGNFKQNDFVEVYMAGNKVRMQWNGKVYVGNKMGLEFTTPGPKVYEVKQGRGF
jgi:hypothetical protein